MASSLPLPPEIEKDEDGDEDVKSPPDIAEVKVKEEEKKNLTISTDDQATLTNEEAAHDPQTRSRICKGFSAIAAALVAILYAFRN